MAENEFGAEKSEEPTPKRLEDARQDGQVAYSRELTVALELLAGFAGLAMLGPWMWSGFASGMRWCLSAGLLEEMTPQMVVVRGLGSHSSLLAPVLLFLGGMLLLVLIIGIAQVGFVLTGKPLIPKFNRINPLTGFQRLFGVRGLVRLAISMAKIVLLVVVAWVVISAAIPGLTQVVPDIRGRFGQEMHSMWRLGMILASLLLAVGIADFLYQRWQHTRDLMMTKQEMREEMKQAEGNPEVKGRIRQIQRQMAQRRMMQEVPKADVVITNPTHVAVALKYEAGKMDAPVVLAKGYDEIAQKIKAIAAEHNIPMVENIALARALARETQIGQAIRPKWFKQVAEVLAAVYRLRKGAA